MIERICFMRTKTVKPDCTVCAHYNNTIKRNAIIMPQRKITKDKQEKKGNMQTATDQLMNGIQFFLSAKIFTLQKASLNSC